MKNVLNNPKTAAIVNLCLVLPGAILFTFLVLGIEPPLGPLAPLLNAPHDGPDVLGTAIALSLICLFPIVALAINLIVLRRSAAPGKGILTYPINFFLALAAMAIIVLFVGGVIADQYPCWIGVPNCD